MYQWITIGVNARREKKIRAEIASYEELLANAENDLAYYESDYYKWLESIKLESIEGNK